ncbi:hypothetical protein DPEC_G00094660 [Dallia pectoralis]|uniref:Uncharacterized protein n=1 Tax=Dallia pectoralis TaxID=75939 RepID=A0ACC2H1A2_DALPE|nr:hypothetical protein DPEC_G00094660 [Dallia pectoralis]
MTGKIGIVTPRQYCCAGLVGHKHAAGRTSSWVGLGGLEAADSGLHLPADDKRALPTCMGSVSDPSAPLSPLRWSAEGYPRSSGANGPGDAPKEDEN